MVKQLEKLIVAQPAVLAAIPAAVTPGAAAAPAAAPTAAPTAAPAGPRRSCCCCCWGNFVGTSRGGETPANHALRAEDADGTRGGARESQVKLGA